MPIKINQELSAAGLAGKLERLFEFSAEKILSIEETWDEARGTPVFTLGGRYTSRGWTEWTQGFQFGSALLQFDATGEQRFLELGRSKIHERMAPHLTHMGVHDHGFNNISTYGNLWRLMREGRIPHDAGEERANELALKVSGAVQAARWTTIARGGGYIYSFNGPHSLFIDTLRSLRSLAVAHRLGHVLMGERDRKISLLDRLVVHALTSAEFAVYYGKGRDIYDVSGRVAHESIFNTNDGSYRCPGTQQGYSPFSTWTRGLAWAILGFAEELEFLSGVPATELQGIVLPEMVNAQPRLGPSSSGTSVLEIFLKAAMAAADYYIAISCADGIPMWDTGAPNLFRLKDYADKVADPFNVWEPVDSSAAAIAAQGLMRLGNYLRGCGRKDESARYRQAALTITGTLLDEPYLSHKSDHQGLLLHSVYHRPNGWDGVGPGQQVPNGESSMWGDYHLRELGLMLLRESKQQPYYAFFSPEAKHVSQKASAQ